MFQVNATQFFASAKSVWRRVSARKEAVTVVSRGRPQAVVLPIEEYNRLVRVRQVFRAKDTPPELVKVLKSASMHRRHAHLDEELD